MNTDIIHIIPIPESKWNKGEGNKKIKIIPFFSKIQVENYENAISWWRIREDDKPNPSWPWWKVKNSNVYLFINFAIGLIGIKDEEDIENYLFIFNFMNNISSVLFKAEIFPYWTREYVGPGKLCSMNNKKLYPGNTMFSIYFGNDENKKELVDKNLEHYPIGIYKYTYEDYELKIDLGEIVEYDSDISRIYGFEEKEDKYVTGITLHKISSLVDILTLDQRLEWNEIIKSFLKKQ